MAPAADHHPIMEPLDRLAAGAGEEPGQEGVDHAGERGAEQAQAEAHGHAPMLAIALADTRGMLGKGSQPGHEVSPNHRSDSMVPEDGPAAEEDYFDLRLD